MKTIMMIVLGLVVSSECLAEAPPLSVDCQKTEGCKNYGWCTTKDGACVAGSDADCQESMWCKTFGRCTAKGGSCVVVATTHAECSQAHGSDGYVPCDYGNGRWQEQLLDRWRAGRNPGVARRWPAAAGTLTPARQRQRLSLGAASPLG
jgi:hypothetical protein